MNTHSDTLWTPGDMSLALAESAPEEIGLYFLAQNGEVQQVNRREIEEWSTKLGHYLRNKGAGQGDRIAIHLPTCPEHIIATLAAFKIGACPTPINDRLPIAERDALLELCEPAILISDASDLAHAISRQQLRALDAYPVTPLPRCISQPAKAIASGGSTGKPKLIVSPGAFAFPKQRHPLAEILDYRATDLVYSPGPLFHNQAFLFSQIALFQGGAIAINERFNAERALDFIEEYKPDVLNLVPTMMQRMLRSESFASRDLSAVRKLWHLAAPCPDWAKLGWMDAIGEDRVWELWAATEITGITTISGSEWLTHRGSVGRGIQTEFLILDENGDPCPVGEVGEIFSRFGDGSPQYSYLGAKPLAETGDGFRSVGDMGRLDQDGYLYLADRRTDLIISGGSNIYPAEVEAAISSHPGVRDVAVIGLADDDLGRKVHAVIEVLDTALDEDTLRAHCAERLARYKVPRSFEFVAALPRNEAGKIRRSALAAERSQ